MKSIHHHVSVNDLAKSITFYNTLFGVLPTVQKTDVAKGMLDDPFVNFAISERRVKTGLAHIGIQMKRSNELAEIKTRLDKADTAMFFQEDTTYYYVKSEMHWVQDLSNIAWETYHTLENSPTFNDADVNATADSTGCVPTQTIQITLQ
jgi:hypothetical protein